MNPWDQFTGANAGTFRSFTSGTSRTLDHVDEATRQAFAAWSPSVEDGIISTGRSPSDTAAAGPPSSRPESRRSRWPNPFAGSAIWPHGSIRSASPSRSATLAELRRRTASPRDVLRRLPVGSSAAPPPRARPTHSKPSSGSRDVLRHHRPRLQPRLRARRARMAATGR